MNELKIFENENLGTVRTITTDSETWFIAGDVCRILGIMNTTQAMQRVDEDERSMFNIGRQGMAAVVNESGLYNLIMSSRKPEAKQFKKWVTSEVLPSIRKHGMYAMDELINNPDLAIKALTALKEEREKNAKLEAVNEELKPKAQLADAVTGSPYTISVGEMAKILNQNGVDIGQNRFYKWLRANGYIMGTNTPTQRAMELKIFVLKESTVCLPDGTQKLVKTPRVTGKGQEYFLKKFAVAAV